MLKILFFPFVLAWKISLGILKLTGKLIGFFLGLFFLIIGVMLSLTLIGAILGIPLILIGLSMILKSLFSW